MIEQLVEALKSHGHDIDFRYVSENGEQVYIVNECWTLRAKQLGNGTVRLRLLAIDGRRIGNLAADLILSDVNRHSTGFIGSIVC